MPDTPPSDPDDLSDDLELHPLDDDANLSGRQASGSTPTEPAGASEPDVAPAEATEPATPESAPAAAGRRRWGRRKGKDGKPRKKAPWWELPLLAAIAIIVAIVVKTWIVQPFYIPSASMENTLHGCPGGCGDRILVNKTIYDLRDPHGGDIVVFHAPSGWDEEPATTPPSNPVMKVLRGFGQLVGFVPPDGLVLVKRVIAVGGQTVKGDAQGHVYISDNGPDGPYRLLNEPYVYAQSTGDFDQFGPVTVPKGRLWVMGDHRDDSADSRYHCGPNGLDAECNPITSTVPVSDVIGKAVLVIWPPSHWRTLGTPATFKAAGAALPGATGALAVFPVFWVRRRRRRRRA